MIARLQGTIVEREVNGVVMDVGGVGYQVNVSLTTLSRLPLMGEQATLMVQTQVREDAITLFGFYSSEERELFRLLLGVAGVGPKLALMVLSGLSPQELAEAITLGDVRRLTRIPGIGKKTAERMVLELAERLPAKMKAIGVDLGGAATDADLNTRANLTGLALAGGGGGRGTGVLADLGNALESLGLKPGEVDRCCRALTKRAKEGAPLEELLKEALKG